MGCRMYRKRHGSLGLWSTHHSDKEHSRKLRTDRLRIADRARMTDDIREDDVRSCHDSPATSNELQTGTATCKTTTDLDQRRIPENTQSLDELARVSVSG